jgi:hypothetical protein
LTDIAASSRSERNGSSPRDDRIVTPVAAVAEGKATPGNFVELLGARIAHVLHTSADLDHVTRAALATQLAESIAEIAPDFDRDRFIEAAQPDADG